MAGGYGSRFKNSSFRLILERIYPPPPILNTISAENYNFIGKSVFGPDKTTLNIGSGNKVGVGSRLWKHVQGRIVNLDIEIGPGVDVVGDAHSLKFSDNSFDSIIMQAVIEHLNNPRLAIMESFRVLKSGGYLYLEVPFLQGFHADPYDYSRYTQVGLKELVKNYGSVELIGVSSGPISFLCWFLRDLFSNITSIRLFNFLIRFFISWMLLPFKYLDYLFIRTNAYSRLACENYILIKKY